MISKKTAMIDTFIRAHGLPGSYRLMMEHYWLPLAAALADQYRGEPLVVAVNGAQGTGKTTMAAALSLLLQHDYQRRSVTISIDDLYSARNLRRQLAASVHPLLQTRGVPGTHDTALGMSLIEQLKYANQRSVVALPRFDKAIDDRLPSAVWPRYRGRPDIILFEGWCVGTQAEPDERLAVAINELERREDSDGVWRRFVNARLADEYRRWFEQIDILIMLKAPDFDAVYRWRGEQEKKLRALVPEGSHLMNRQQLARFIQHYERLTRFNLDFLPALADMVFEFDSHHAIRGVRRHGRFNLL